MFHKEMVLSLMNLDTYNQKKKNEKGAFVQLFESKTGSSDKNNQSKCSN
jgi:hypothetical protein